MKKLDRELKKNILNNIFIQIYCLIFLYMIVFPWEISLYRNYVYIIIIVSLLVYFMVIVYLKYTITNKFIEDLNFIRLDKKN